MRMFFKANAKAAETNPKAAEMLRVMKDGFDGTKCEYLESALAYIYQMEERTKRMPEGLNIAEQVRVLRSSSNREAYRALQSLQETKATWMMPSMFTSTASSR